MQAAVIFATGSPIVVDVEESLYRSGIELRAGIQNRDGVCYLTNPALRVILGQFDPVLAALPFIVPLFTPANRQKAVREARDHGFRDALSLIDASVARPRQLKHDEGLYIGAGCSLGAASTFGSFVFVNRGASVGHHLTCGAFVSIGPGAVIAGQVRIGLGSFIGAGAVILPELSIGANAVVGAGAVVTRDVPDRTVVAGNPARIIRDNIAGYGNQAVEAA